MSKVILTEQVRDSFTQEQADQRYLSREGDIANGDITLNIADGRKAFSIANLDTGTYAYLASDSSQAELSLMSLQLTSNSNEASINSSTDININSDSHEVNLNVSSVNVPEPTTNTSAVPKSYVDSNFVSQESGKGLSTNDFTTEEKNKLAGVANNANNYTLPAASSTTLGGVKVGSGLSISNGVLSTSGGGLQVIAEGTLSVTSPWGGGNSSVTFDKAAVFVLVTVNRNYTSPDGAGICLPGDTCTVVEEGNGLNEATVRLSPDGTRLSIDGDYEQRTNYIAIG